MIKIMIIDDHTLVRAALKEMLGNIKGFTVVAEAATAQAGMEVLRRLNPDLILLDLQLPDLSGLALTQKLLRLDSDIKILVVSAVVQDLSVFQLLEAGARGYVPKNAHPEELLQAIKAVHCGQRFISPRLAARLALRKIDYRKKDLFAEISTREMEVMTRVIRGIPVKDIAEQLKLSHKTIHTYRSRIFEKLGVDSDLAVTLLAIRSGLITLEINPDA